MLEKAEEAWSGRFCRCPPKRGEWESAGPSGDGKASVGGSRPKGSDLHPCTLAHQRWGTEHRTQNLAGLILREAALQAPQLYGAVQSTASTLNFCSEVLGIDADHGAPISTNCNFERPSWAETGAPSRALLGGSLPGPAQSRQLKTHPEHVASPTRTQPGATVPAAWPGR